MRNLLRFVVLPILVLLGLSVGLIWFLSEGITGERHPRGKVAGPAVPAEAVQARKAARESTAARIGAPADRQILFGDLHVHTTYSADAFVFSLPLFQGEGVHPPADACDFARFCAELDFWSINDHAEALTPWQWEETVASIRECNEVSGDSAHPDTVAFLGWEWTQSAPGGFGNRTHWGHKNVVLAGLEDDEIPARPIGAGDGGLFDSIDIPSAGWALVRAGLTIGDFPDNLTPYLDFNAWARDVRGLAPCPKDVPVRELPADCLEGAPTPAELFEKLDDWGHPSIVIPHGLAWGIHAPSDADLGEQLKDGQHDAARQRLIEVYSGHGNSELWRDLRDTEVAADGSVRCAAPEDGYLPCCWRAGEIIEERCRAEGHDDTVCTERAERTKGYFLELPSGQARGVVPGTEPDDWLECGQLAGTFLPAFEYRPRMSAQYGLAVRPEGATEGADGAFRFGFIASSDNHKARPGPGYKEVGRKAFGDAYGLRQDWLDRLAPEELPAAAEPRRPEEIRGTLPSADPGSERNASYYYTAGLVAVHADGRDRDAIFDALENKRTYGTSGPRILLHFDLENAPGGTSGMGSEVEMAQPPRFRVRATGAFRQKPGCPAHARERLGEERLARLCLGECWHPSESRHRIDRIEVVRIRPQLDPEEKLDGLIEDPWKVFTCEPDEAGCVVEFEDPEFKTAGRETIYYVRALQEPTAAVNGDPMRCERDEDGKCVKARFCAASGESFAPDDECLATVRERAWSSPIFVRPADAVPEPAPVPAPETS